MSLLTRNPCPNLCLKFTLWDPGALLQSLAQSLRRNNPRMKNPGTSNNPLRHQSPKDPGEVLIHPETVRKSLRTKTQSLRTTMKSSMRKSLPMNPGTLLRKRSPGRNKVKPSAWTP